MRGAVAIAIIGLMAGSAGAERTPWADARRPSPGNSQAIGGTSAGCLAGAVALPVAGRGWRVMRPERRRHFAHREMAAFVRALAAAARKAGLPPVALGDLSQPRGGPAPSGHSSHQTGLDADIWYAIGKRGRRPEPAPMVDRARNRPAPRWGAAQVKLVALAAADPRVDRVFVHPVLKRALCRSARGDRSWLRRVRPWWGHDEHFHVRLRCPAGDGGCLPQAAIPEGDGCGEIDGWLAPEKAAERAEKQKSYQSRVGAAPVLPDACRALLD